MLQAMLAAEATSVAALIASVSAAVIAAVGTAYATHRQAQVQHEQTEQTASVEGVKTAQAVLVETIKEMREEMRRQDEEHARSMSVLVADVDRFRADLRACVTERAKLRRELAIAKGER